MPGVSRVILALLLPVAAFGAVQPLFNGKDLAGWKQQGPHPSFTSTAGEIRTSGRGRAGNWIHTEQEFENFRLRFEYKLNQWAEAAVLLRAARSDRPQHTGVSIVLAHDFHNETTPFITGAVMGVLPPRKTLPASFQVWHSVVVELRGHLLMVTIDGDSMQDVDMGTVPALRHRLRKGVIGFPDMGHGYAVRNLTIEELAGRTEFVELLAGLDGTESDAAGLKAWGRRGDSGQWRVHSGVLQGMNGHSILYAPPAFRDFELTAVVRSHDRANAGIFLRGQPAGANRGFEVQIYSPVDAVYQTGSIYARARSSLSADLEEQWFLLQILVEGARCTVWVNGEQVADYDKLPAELQGAGRIGAQIHMEDTRVEVRDLRVRPL